jgi:DNA-binding response OmpR family regulator
VEILVIEDESRIQAFVARALKAEGFVVRVADNGPEGLARALAHPPALVVLDLLLPGLDGLELLRRLHERKPDLPVLILSARSDLDTKLRGFDLGAVDFLVKPFSLDELLARVRVQLRPREPAADDPYVMHAGGLRLDLARREARMGSRVSELTDGEFRLLHVFFEHAGEVLSREQLLADAWGYDFDPRSNVVEVSIRRLRRRLGPDSPIETVRNAGYRLAAR